MVSHQKSSIKSVLGLLGLLFTTSVILTGCQQGTIPSANDPLSMGETLFSNNCASCHGVTGAGASMMIRSQGIAFNSPQWQKKYTDEQITNIIRNGRASMPNFNFEPDEEKALVLYIRQLAKATE